MNKNDAHVDVIFPNPESAGERAWGTETILCIIPNVLSLKELRIKKGAKGGLQYHRLKNECGFLIKGKLLVRFDAGDGTLSERIINEGEAFHFPPRSIHQEEAIEDCVIIEASTPHFNDRVRVEKQYGLAAGEGLASTNLEDIQIR